MELKSGAMNILKLLKMFISNFVKDLLDYSKIKLTFLH